MPKVVPESQKRVVLNCLVAPETMVWLKAQKDSRGAAVDRAVAWIQSRDGMTEVLRERFEQTALVVGIPIPEPTNPTMTGELMVLENDVGVETPTQRMPVPKWKRGPRQKGDKSR